MAHLLLYTGVIALVLRNTLLMRKRDVTEFAAVDAAVYFDLCAMVVIGLGLLGSSALLMNFFRRRWASSSGLLLAFVGLSLASAYWSVNPSYSFVRAAQMALSMLAMLVVFSLVQRVQRAEQHFLLTAFGVLILSLLGHIISNDSRLTLGGLHANSYPCSAAMICCYCAGEFWSAFGHRRTILLLAGCAACAGTFLGTSAGSSIALACGVLATVFASLRSRLVLLGFLVSTAVGFAILAKSPEVIVRLQPVLFPFKDVEQVESMSGRAAIWDQAYQMGMQRPWFGHGYAAAVRQGELPVNSEHNVVLAVFASLGLAGVILFGLWLALLAWECTCAVSASIPLSRGCLGAVVAGMVNSLSAPFLGVIYTPAIVIFACVVGVHAVWVLPSITASTAMSRPRRQDGGLPVQQLAPSGRRMAARDGRRFPRGRSVGRQTRVEIEGDAR